jgi:hypothetical protein
MKLRNKPFSYLTTFSTDNPPPPRIRSLSTNPSKIYSKIQFLPHQKDTASSRLILFRESIAAYSEHCTKHTDAVCTECGLPCSQESALIELNPVFHISFKNRFNTALISTQGASGSVIGWGTMLQAGLSRVRFPMKSLDFFNWRNSSSSTMALRSSKPVTEMSTRNLHGAKGRQERSADNRTAIFEPNV